MNGRRISPWWKGVRGEWYVVLQALLVLLVIFGPAVLPGIPEPVSPYEWPLLAVGGSLIAAGIILAIAGTFSLGKNLTPLPHPKSDAVFIRTGAYRLVRHPIYSGIIFIAFGWAFWLQSIPKTCYALILLIFFDIKSRREERWLEEKFLAYSDYKRRVRKLIPFLY